MDQLFINNNALSINAVDVICARLASGAGGGPRIAFMLPVKYPMTDAPRRQMRPFNYGKWLGNA